MTGSPGTTSVIFYRKVIDDQGTKWRRNIAENFNRLSRAHERTLQTNDRQTHRRTGDDIIANVTSLKRMSLTRRRCLFPTCGRYGHFLWPIWSHKRLTSLFVSTTMYQHGRGRYGGLACGRNRGYHDCRCLLQDSCCWQPT